MKYMYLLFFDHGSQIWTLIHVKFFLVLLFFFLDITHLLVCVAANLRLCNNSHFTDIPAVAVLELGSLNGFSWNQNILLDLMGLNDTLLLVLRYVNRCSLRNPIRV